MWSRSAVVMTMNTNRLLLPPVLDDTCETLPVEPLQPLVNTPAPMGRRWWHRVLMFGLVAGVLYGGWGWWSQLRGRVTTDNAQVSGHINTVSSRVAGTVAEVLVEENQEVRAGMVLARLDPGDLKVQRDRAAALLVQAESQLAQARAQVGRDAALGRKAGLDFERADKLFQGGSGVISKQEFDSSSATRDAAIAALEASKAMELAAAAQVGAAAAQLEEMRLLLGYTEIKAPVAGRIGRKNLEVGNRVQSGQSLLSIVQPEIWVSANFKETQVDRIRPGQSVLLTLDGFPGEALTGTVESFAPASGSQFALLQPDNATGNYTKVVQRIPVKIRIDRESQDRLSGRIVPGMSVVVSVSTGQTTR